MRWGLASAALLVASTAHAQPGAAPGGGTAMETYRVEARDAALRGDCKMAGTIARLVSDVDPRYYAEVFLRDTVIVSCNGGVGGVTLPPSSVAPSTVALSSIPASSAPPSEAASPVPPRPRTGLTDTGRGALGFFAGIGAGAGLGFVGLIVAGTIADKQHPNCSSFCDEVMIPAVIGGQIGMSLGLAIGITTVGNHKDGKGSFATSVALGVVGSGVSWLFALNDSTVDNGLFGITFFTLPVVGAMSGYWLTHEHTSVTVVPTGNGLALSGRF